MLLKNGFTVKNQEMEFIANTVYDYSEKTHKIDYYFKALSKYKIQNTLWHLLS